MTDKKKKNWWLIVSVIVLAALACGYALWMGITSGASSLEATSATLDTAKVEPAASPVVEPAPAVVPALVPVAPVPVAPAK
jgi:flagellar basal body-associated protein FliL